MEIRKFKDPQNFRFASDDVSQRLSSCVGYDSSQYDLASSDEPHVTKLFRAKFTI